MHVSEQKHRGVLDKCVLVRRPDTKKHKILFPKRICTVIFLQLSIYAGGNSADST